MAVEDKYINSNISGNTVDKVLPGINAHGAEIKVAFGTFEVAAADDNGSKYRVFKNVDPNLIPVMVMIGNDAITAGTDWDLGLYKADLGAVIDADVFLDGADLSSAHASLNPKTALDGLATVAIENLGKRIFEHAGHTITTRLEAYDIVLTANTVGTAAGTVSVLIVFAQG